MYTAIRNQPINTLSVLGCPGYIYKPHRFTYDQCIQYVVCCNNTIYLEAINGTDH